MTRAALPSGIVNTFEYDGDGDFVESIAGGYLTNILWDDGFVLAEYDSNNIIQALYSNQRLYGGVPLSQLRSGISCFYLYDTSLSTRQLSTSSGNISDSYLYDSFGNALITVGSSVNPFRFCSSALYYPVVDLPYLLRNSDDFYDTTIGRLIGASDLFDNMQEVSPYVINDIMFYRGSNQLQNPLIGVSLLKGPCLTLGDCGGSASPVNFSVSGNGTIIQKVALKVSAYSCDKGEIRQTINYNYYEAWSVVRGKVIPKGDSSRLGGKYNDVFMYCGLPKTCGTLDYTGQLAFFQGYKILNKGNNVGIGIPARGGKRDDWYRSPLPPGFKMCGNTQLPHPSGVLWHTKNGIVPIVWRNPITASHSMSRTWNCCEECVPSNRCSNISSTKLECSTFNHLPLLISPIIFLPRG